MSRWVAAVVLLVSVIGCGTDDGADADGSTRAGVVGASSSGDSPPGSTDGPGGSGAGTDGADPDASGPGTEPPLLPVEGTRDGAAGSDAEPDSQDSMDSMGAAGSEAPASDSAIPPEAAAPLPVAAECDLTRTRTFLDDGKPVVEGDLCDDVVVCVDDLDAAAALTAVAPGFQCDDGENPMGLCDEAQLRCIWRPSVLDAGEAAQLCAATSVLPETGEVVCIVYL